MCCRVKAATISQRNPQAKGGGLRGKEWGEGEGVGGGGGEGVGGGGRSGGKGREWGEGEGEGVGSRRGRYTHRLHVLCLPSRMRKTLRSAYRSTCNLCDTAKNLIFH